MWNRILIAVLAFATVAVPAAAEPDSEDQQESKSIIRETENRSAFRGSLYSVWLKLRSFSPGADNERAGRGELVATAGIRGAESTESSLQPYWKDDRADDKDYVAQLESFSAIQSMLDAGRIDDAQSALGKFIEQYPRGELLPNALFAQGLALGAAGDKENGVRSLQRFVKDYPEHPLKADAESLIAELAAK